MTTWTDIVDYGMRVAVLLMPVIGWILKLSIERQQLLFRQDIAQEIAKVHDKRETRLNETRGEILKTMDTGFNSLESAIRDLSQRVGKVEVAVGAIQGTMNAIARQGG